MHYHLEIIMPPSKNIEESINQIMNQFSEQNEMQTGNEFWDWFVIGGRWAGTKETCRYDAEKIEQFYKELQDLNVTVSGLQAGKQELKPASQTPMVDKLWCKYFPTENGEITACPLFNHSNNKYDSNDLISCDISRVDEIPEQLKASRVIIAGPHWEDTDKVECKFMLCDEQWNGINFMTIDWNGKVNTVLEKYNNSIKSYKDEYREKNTPQPDWICVTVDYHS